MYVCVCGCSFKNGSLTRERIRDQLYPGGSWEGFSAALRATPPGNDGIIGDHPPLLPCPLYSLLPYHHHPVSSFSPPGFYFDRMEITPPVVGVYRFDSDDNEVGGLNSKL